MLGKSHGRSGKALIFAIGLEVICSRDQVINAQRDCYSHKEVWFTLQSFGTQQIRRNPLEDDPIDYKHGGCISGGYCGDQYGPGQFDVSHCQENGVYGPSGLRRVLMHNECDECYKKGC